MWTLSAVIVPSLFAADLDLGDVVAAMCGRDVVFAAGLHPLDRAAVFMASAAIRQVFRIEEDLGPKPPPIWGEITRIFVSGMPKTNAVISKRMTCGACEVIQTVYSPVAGMYCGNAAAWLHRRGDQPLVDQRLP